MVHIFLSLTAAFLLAGVPMLYVLDMSKGKDIDAVSGASIKLPDKPSGDYIVLLNRSLHEDSVDDWIKFFRDGELNVIFSKAENGCIDAAIFSKEMADSLKLRPETNKSIVCISVKGGEDE